MIWRSNKQLHTFHGGIHPPENKDQSTQTPVEAVLLPDKLILPLQQHIGQQAKPLVKVGDKVLKGQMIAAPVGYVSAALHAPTSGTVIAIENHALPHPSGLSELCIIIEPDGKELWTERSPIKDYQQVDKALLLQRISDSGITGLGGAGFPAAVKLNPSEDLHIKTLILNAAECEPYITADDMLMRERADEVILGLQIIAHILQPEKCLIGIENNKPQAIAALQQAVEALALKDKIKIVSIPVKYPSGGEKQLIQILTGKEVPNGGIPADIGMVCQNVGTAVAVYRAISKGEPLISRITTVTGDAVSQQGNIEVLLGTPIETLLAHFDLQQDQLHRLVMGGPMMGFTLDSVSLPVVKATNCILAATNKELPDPEPEQACIRCGMCAEVCPATLLPQQLYWFSKSKEFDKALSHNLLDCIECGACSYVCPSNIPLVQYYRFAKGEIRIEEQERTASDHARLRFEARTARLEQEEAEKEAKRKARAGAAKKVDKTDTDKSAADPKAAVIQAALERAQARKAAKAASQNPEGAVADNTTETPSAVERAKARKAAAKSNNSASASSSNDGLTALQRAQAKRNQKAGTANTDETVENDKAPVLSAVERAKARKAAAQTNSASDVENTTSSTNTKDDQSIATTNEKQVAATLKNPSNDGLSALERAKLKRTQKETIEASADSQQPGDDSKPLSALERAKAKRNQNKDTAADDLTTDKKTSPVAGLSALDRAKAKRAEKAANDASTDTEKSD